MCTAASTEEGSESVRERGAACQERAGRGSGFSLDGTCGGATAACALFSLAGYRSARNRQQYDLAPDGRFLMIRDLRPGEAAPVVYASGWLAELRALLRR